MQGEDHAAPVAATRVYLKPATLDAARDDVVDETVTSWMPDNGCHGYGDAGEVQQQQHGGEALCMTRLD